MAYTKPDQTPFAANLQACEFVVQLDSGEFIAVCSDAKRVSGNVLAVAAGARQVDATGMQVADSNAHDVQSSMSHSFDAATVDTFTAAALQKDCLLLVLGETPLVFGATPGLPQLPQDVLDSYSVRHAIAIGASTGPANAGSLL